MTPVVPASMIREALPKRTKSYARKKAAPF
jgi:hypothetical protein